MVSMDAMEQKFFIDKREPDSPSWTRGFDSPSPAPTSSVT
jgi:hypothetical protein